MKFHSGPRFGLSEEDQAAIYWLCTSYERLSPETRQVIDDAIRSVGGIYAVPLREAVTRGVSVPSIRSSQKRSPSGNPPAETPLLYDTLTKQGSFRRFLLCSSLSRPSAPNAPGVCCLCVVWSA